MDMRNYLARASRRSRAAWSIYLAITLAVLVFYVFCALPPSFRTDQGRWDNQAEWLGPAKVEDCQREDLSSDLAFLLDVDDARVSELMERLACREMSPEEKESSDWKRHLERTAEGFQMDGYPDLELGDMYVSDACFYFHDPLRKKQSAGGSPEEQLREHRLSSRQYGIARVSGAGKAKILLCGWNRWNRYEGSGLADPQPLLPTYLELHADAHRDFMSGYPDWLALVMIAGMLLGMNAIGNGLAFMCNGLPVTHRALLWLAAPLVGWVAYFALNRLLEMFYDIPRVPMEDLWIIASAVVVAILSLVVSSLGLGAAWLVSKLASRNGTP